MTFFEKVRCYCYNWIILVYHAIYILLIYFDRITTLFAFHISSELVTRNDFKVGINSFLNEEIYDEEIVGTMLRSQLYCHLA